MSPQGMAPHGMAPQGTTPQGWYPDPMRQGTLRYYDGAAWTAHWMPVPPPQVAPARKGNKGLVIGLVAGGLALLIPVMAAIAIPVFLNQREKAQLVAARAMTCETLAADAVALEAANAMTGTPNLTGLTELVMVADHRQGLDLPAEGAENPVMTCQGLGLWSDGYEQAVEVSGTVDSTGATWFVWTPLG